MVMQNEYDLSSLRLRQQQDPLGSLELSLPSLALRDLNLNPGLGQFRQIQPLSLSEIARMRARQAAEGIDQQPLDPRTEYDPSSTPEVADTELTRELINAEEERQANTGFLGHVGRALGAGLEGALNLKVTDPTNLIPPVAAYRVARNTIDAFNDELEDPGYTIGDILQDADAYVFRPGYGTVLSTLNAVPGLDYLLFRGQHYGSETIDYWQTLAEELTRERPDGWYRNIDDAFAAAYDAMETRRYVKGASEILLDPTNFVPFVGGGKAIAKGASSFQALRATTDLSGPAAALRATQDTASELGRAFYTDTPIRGVTLAAKGIPEAGRRMAFLARYGKFNTPQELAEHYDKLGGNITQDEVGALRDTLQNAINAETRDEVIAAAEYLKASNVIAPRRDGAAVDGHDDEGCCG